MQGKTDLMSTITDGLSTDWYIRHFPGREQPYTLQRRRFWKNDRHYSYETWSFHTTAQAAQGAADREDWRRRDAIA